MHTMRTSTSVIALAITGKFVANSASCSACTYGTVAGQAYGYVLKLGVCDDNSAYNWAYNATGYGYSPRAFVVKVRPPIGMPEPECPQ